MQLKDFKDTLGKPLEDFHKYRINIFGLSLAFNDFFGTIFIGIIITLLIGLPFFFKLDLSRLNFKDMIIYWISILIPSIVFIFIIGIILHYIFHVNTELNTFIFGKLN